MPFKKSLAVGSMLLILAGEPAAQEVENNLYARVTYSHGTTDFVQSIDEGEEQATVHYRNWGDISRVAIESFLGAIEAYDDNNDGRIDVITLKPLEAGSEKEHVSFYRGPTHLEYLVAAYPNLASSKTRKIPNTETGFVEYSNGALIFRPSSDTVVRSAFSFVDKLYTELLFLSPHWRHMDNGSKAVPGLHGQYYSRVQRLLSRP